MSQSHPSKYGAVWSWQSEMAPDLRFPFAGAETLSTNHSQAWQDIFILSMLGGLRDGRYLEVGGHQPEGNNNTNLLHRRFGWSGVTLEYDPAHFQAWLKHRPDSMLVMVDALILDYAQAMPLWFGTNNKRIDYLQLDIDPSTNTLAVLKRLPLDTYRFSIITFETDAYTKDLRARDESRALLTRHGYELVAGDVTVLFPTISPSPIPFEDWWVDPEVIDADKIRIFQSLAQTTSAPQDLLFAR